MNLLHDIFLEIFSKRYYFRPHGRAYVEYVQNLGDIFTGQVCFFHFSHENPTLNSYHNYEIMKFIKLFYGNAYKQLMPMMRMAIKDQFVMSMNSFDEYRFVIKFWNENGLIRQLFEEFIYKHTGSEFQLENDPNMRFFELEINLKDGFHIDAIIVYWEEDLRDEVTYSPGYIEKDNIFMTLRMHKYSYLQDSTLQESGILVKLNKPICFYDSPYLMQHAYSGTKIPFSEKTLHLAFIEQGFKDEKLYFTHNYSIPA